MKPAPLACPCIDAHRRLMDLHEDIHRATESYLDANEFRRFLNSAIQNARGVTFLLQKRKSKWSDFDSWYNDWQDDARSNPILSWGVRSRNRIVKEEDLLTFSQAIISYYGERLQEAEDVVTVPPQTTVHDMLHTFAAISGTRPQGRRGWVRVQRRWVDDQRPDHELVAALREIYAGVATVIRRAHTASRVDTCLAPPFSRPCVTAEIDSGLRCLGPGEPLPTGLIDVTSGEMMRLGYGSFERDESLIDIGRKRYGLIPDAAADAIEHAAGRMELSKRFLEADGYSGPMLLLFRGANEKRMHPLFFGKHEPRELKIAGTIELNGSWPFDGAVFATEAWLTSEPGQPSRIDVPLEQRMPSNEDFFDPSDSPNRDEALVVFAVTEDGRSRVMVLPFARTANGVVYGELSDDASGTSIPPMLRPVWRRWKKWRDGPPQP